VGAKKQLEWSLFAERGLEAVYDYIATDNPLAAENVVRHLLMEAAGLTAFPMVGHEGKRAGTRELVLSKYPYTLIYRLSANKVRIVAVLHQSRQYP
jgi:plasmid stabilization system protein ParE